MACNRVLNSIPELVSRVRPNRRIISARMMSSQALTCSQQFLVQVPDLPNTQEIRARTKHAHIAVCTLLIENGRLSYFGVTMSGHSGSDEAAMVNGSVMVLEADDENSVRNFLERDAYTKAGVWNIEKAQIWAFKSG